MELQLLDTIFTSEALMDQTFDPPKWVIEDLIPEGLTVLAGAPKIGKSWLSLQIANAVATGEPLFGRKASKQEGVFVLALEDNPRRLQLRMDKGKFKPSKQLNFAVEFPLGPRGLAEYLNQNNDIKLVIIDTLAIFLPAQSNRGQNAYDSDVGRMRQLHSIVKNMNVSIIVIHHDKQSEEGDWANKISGSSGIIGTADTLMRLSVTKRGSKEGNLQVTGRDVEDVELSLKLEESLMHWCIDKKRDEKPLPPLHKEVLNLIPDAPETTSSKSISESLSKEQSQISEILTKLRNAGHIESPAWAEYTKSKT